MLYSRIDVLLAKNDMLPALSAAFFEDLLVTGVAFSPGAIGIKPALVYPTKLNHSSCS